MKHLSWKLPLRSWKMSRSERKSFVKLKSSKSDQHLVWITFGGKLVDSIDSRKAIKTTIKTTWPGLTIFGEINLVLRFWENGKIFEKTFSFDALLLLKAMTNGTIIIIINMVDACLLAYETDAKRRHLCGPKRQRQQLHPTNPPTRVTRFGEFSKTLAICYRVYTVFGKILNLLWQIYYVMWQISL